MPSNLLELEYLQPKFYYNQRKKNLQINHEFMVFYANSTLNLLDIIPFHYSAIHLYHSIVPIILSKWSKNVSFSLGQMFSRNMWINIQFSSRQHSIWIRFDSIAFDSILIVRILIWNFRNQNIVQKFK